MTGMKKSDDRVVITGVTGYGVGAALANCLAERGARVVGAGRRVEQGEAWERKMRENGADALFVPCDVRRLDDCSRLMEMAAHRFGGIDVLINNAGTVGNPTLVNSHDVDEELWDQVLDVNLKGAFFCSRFAIPHLLRQDRGLILNISSRRATMAGPRMVAYASSKAAMMHMGVSLAEEYRSTSLCINSILMGGVVGESSTAMIDELLASGSAMTDAVMGGEAAPIEDRIKNQLATAEQAAEGIVSLIEEPYRTMSGAVFSLLKDEVDSSRLIPVMEGASPPMET